MSNQIIFIINKGVTFERRIEYIVDNEPRDLTGFTGKMQFRPSFNSNSVYCTLTTTPDVDGTGLVFTPISGSTILPETSGSIGIYISAASSSQFPDNAEGVFDLLLISGSGTNYYSELVFQGKSKFLPVATR